MGQKYRYKYVGEEPITTMAPVVADWQPGEIKELDVPLKHLLFVPVDATGTAIARTEDEING